MNATDLAAARKQITDTFAARIDAIEQAITADQGGYVFCWDRYGLGVAFNNGKPQAVAVENATVTTKNDGRTAVNGANEPAVLMTRKWALECALRTVSASLAHLEALCKDQALGAASPHGRDYQTLPAGSLSVALSEHADRMVALRKVRAEIETIAEHLV